jgi:hypothetical protein
MFSPGDVCFIKGTRNKVKILSKITELSFRDKTERQNEITANTELLLVCFTNKHPELRDTLYQESKSHLHSIDTLHALMQKTDDFRGILYKVTHPTKSGSTTFINEENLISKN